MVGTNRNGVFQAYPDAPGHCGGGGAELQARGLLQNPADLEGRGLGVQREDEVLYLQSGYSVELRLGYGTNYSAGHIP